MPPTRQHLPTGRAAGPAPAGPSRPGTPTSGGRGNAAEADRVLGRAGAAGGASTGTETTTGVATTGTSAAAPAAAGTTAAVDAAAPAGAIVLSREATRAGLRSSVERVQVWAGEWEVPFSASWLRLDSASAAVVLDWPAAWGAPPVTRDLSLGNMRPFDARWSVKHAHDSAGWGVLDGAMQTRVEAVLAGETNGVSSMAQSVVRRAVRDGWETKPAEEQAKTLSDLVTTNASRPFRVAERSTGPRAQITRAGPTEVTGHAFASGAADALRYTLTWPDGHAIPVYVPKTKDASLGYHTIEQVEEAIGYLPDATRKLVNTVQLNPGRNPLDEHWAREYGRANFRSYMTGGVSGVIDIYPDSSGTAAPQRTIDGAFQHESGHVWSQRTWGTDMTKGRWVDWRAAMDTDRVAVSGYAGADIQEDVAETVQAYNSTKGTPTHDEFRRMVPARFAILDTDLK